MRSNSKMLIGLVLACLLVPFVSGAQRPLSCTHPHNRNGRDHQRVRARLSRCRGDNPVHHPVRPCKNAMLPPDDEDNVDPKHSHLMGNYGRLPDLSHDSTFHPHSSMPGSRPLPTEVPRHQTLCILLI